MAGDGDGKDPAAPNPDRECGECRMCCKAMFVAELDKPAGQWCPHAGDHPGGGCGIYADRPKACREFYCSWRLDRRGLFRDDERPDKLGVVFWVMENAGTVGDGRRLDVVVAQEGTQGVAMQRARTRALLERLMKKGVPLAVAWRGDIAPVALTSEGRAILNRDRVVYKDAQDSAMRPQSQAAAEPEAGDQPEA